MLNEDDLFAVFTEKDSKKDKETSSNNAKKDEEPISKSSKGSGSKRPLENRDDDRSGGRPNKNSEEQDILELEEQLKEKRQKLEDPDIE